MDWVQGQEGKLKLVPVKGVCFKALKALEWNRAKEEHHFRPENYGKS